MRDPRLHVVLGQVDDGDGGRLGTRATSGRRAEQRQQRSGHGRALADRRIEVVVDAARVAGQQRGDLGGVDRRPAAEPDEPVEAALARRLDRQRHRRLARLDAAAGEDLGLDARRPDRLDDGIDEADRREVRVGDHERARHARPAEVPAGLERAARPEDERRAGDGEDALVDAHGTTSHSSVPSVSLSSSNGIMRGTMPRVVPLSRSEAASSLVDWEAANNVDVG